jgi:microsomal dipeptidase-like Zn-dependent dipeptidase
VIEAGGTELTILGSDLGQVDNPTPVSGFKAVIRLCIELGFDDPAIRKLVGGNAARLLELPQ